MKNLRYYIRRFHRFSGLLIAVPFAVISLSGALLAFEPQILRWAYADLYYVSDALSQEPRSIDEVSRRVQDQIPEGMTLGTLRIGRPDEAWVYEITSMRKAELFVDPVSCRVLGSIDHDQGFFFQVRKIHRWLGDTLDRSSDRPGIGRMVVGVVSFWSVLVILSGLYLWFPRSRNAFRMRFRWSVSSTAGYARFYQRHTLLGFWCSLPVLALALTGLTWSFPEYRDGFYTLCGAEYKNRKLPEHLTAPSGEYRQWDRALPLVYARHEHPEWIRFGQGEVEVASAGLLPSVSRYVLAVPSQTLEPFPGEVDRARKVRSALVAVHEGLWLGFLSQMLTFLCALTAAYLSWSGLRMFMLRRSRPRAGNK